MMQFYFLSIVSNFVAGLILSSDWFTGKVPVFASFASGLAGRRAKLVFGLAALLVGFGTLFVPAEGPLVIGDLFPSVMGMVMGIALLFEVFKQASRFPNEPAERAERPAIAYRSTLGFLGLAAAVLHFFLPERLLL
jgi:hypothetical protein